MTSANTHKGIEIPMKHPRWSTFAKIFSGSHQLINAKGSTLGKWQGSEYASK